MTITAPRWRSVLEQDRSLPPPWSPAKLPRVLEQGMRPHATLEERLRCAHTLHRASETAEGSAALRAIPSIIAALQYLFAGSDDSPCGARLKEHVLLTNLGLLSSSSSSSGGSDLRFDEALSYDEVGLQQMKEALRSPYVVVVAAAVLLVRRISELEHVATILVFDDSMFAEILVLIETVTDPRVQEHILCCLVNLSAHPKLQFVLARCARLLQWLMDGIFAGGAVLHHQAHLDAEEDDVSLSADAAALSISVTLRCVRTIANLLASGENRLEMQRIVPSISEALLSCHVEGSSRELQEAVKLAVALLHGPPRSQPLRSQLLAELSPKGAAAQ